MINAYGYARFSDDSQQHGTSESRQRTQFDEVCKAKGWNLKKVYFDGKAISAFKSKNIEDGVLGDLINDVETGKIKKGEVIILENLDRFSRDKVHKSHVNLVNLLRHDVRLYDIHNDCFYGGEDNYFFDNMMTMARLQQAHDESKKKRERTTKHALELIEKHQNGELPNIKINSVGTDVWWCDYVKKDHPKHKFVELNEVKANAVRDIFNMYAKGYSQKQIAEYLTGKVKTPRGGERWSTSSVAKQLQSRTVLGEKTFSLDDIEPITLTNYYPQIIDEKLFYSVKNIISKNKKTKKGRKSSSNLLGGSKVVFCKCGAPMHYTSGNYYCTGKYANRTDCSGVIVRNTLLDNIVVWIGHHKFKRPEHIIENTDVNEALKQELETKIDTLSNDINDLIDEGTPVAKGLYKKLAQLEQELAEVEQQIEADKIDSNPVEIDASSWNNINPKVFDPNESELRTELTDIIKNSFQSVEVSRLEHKILDRSRFKSFKVIMTMLNGEIYEAISDGKSIYFYQLDELTENFLNPEIDIVLVSELEFRMMERTISLIHYPKADNTLEYYKN